MDNEVTKRRNAKFKEDGSIRLFFGELKKTQRSIARLIRARNAHKISDADYRAILTGFNLWLAFSKHIKDIDIEQKMQTIEARLEALVSAKI